MKQTKRQGFPCKLIMITSKGEIHLGTFPSKLRAKEFALRGKLKQYEIREIE